MTSKSVTASVTLSPALPTPWKPRNYMRRSVKFLLEHACGGLFLDPGMGKTAITLATIKILIQQKLIQKVLIIAPLRPCYLVWPKELQKWVDFHGLTMTVLHGPKKDELLKQKSDIYVINPEGLEWLTQAVKTKTTHNKVKVSVDLTRWKSLGFDLLVVDELSKFKHTNTTRFKMIKLVLGFFRRRWGLTGSPAANGLMGLFGQMYILDQGRSLGQFITHYRMKYFEPVDLNGYVWRLQPDAEKLIYKRIAPVVLRLGAEDYLEMPELVENIIRVDLPEKVRKMYDQMENDLLARINSHIVTASTAAASSTKCRQIANGGIYLEPGLLEGFKLPPSEREWVNLHTEKVDALEDLIDELQGQPLLVAYDFEHDFDRIKKKFGDDVPYIGSGVSTRRELELEILWNAGKLPLLFGHPMSIAHGLNLQEQAQHVCWHSLTWDYELYDQFVRRIRRQGNKAKRVFSHLIVARKTIDEVMLATLRAKEKGQTAFFDGLKKLAVSRSKKS